MSETRWDNTMTIAKGTRSARRAAALIVGLLLAAPSYAYLDPGTGSIILQGILASIAVAMGVLRLYWHRFKAFFSSLTGASKDSTGGDGHDIAKDTKVQNEP
jgi:hypothetical protein